MGSATQRSKRMGLGEMPVGPEEQFYQPLERSHFRS